MAKSDRNRSDYERMDGKRKEEKDISTSFKIFLTAWAFVENGLFSGLRAGWSALVYILKQERIYANLCSDNNGNSSDSNQTLSGIKLHEHSNGSNDAISCDEQDAIFNECFTVATAAMALSALLYGHLNYKFGIRAPRLLSVVVFVGGACCFAFVDKDIPWLIFPGLLLVSSGGMALYITNNQISYMFTTTSAAVVGLLCGALEASSIVQTIIKIMYEHGISLFISYLTLAGLYSLTLISTIFFLPKDFVHSKQVVEASEDVLVETNDTGQPTQPPTTINDDSGVSDMNNSNSVNVDGSNLHNTSLQIKASRQDGVDANVSPDPTDSKWDNSLLSHDGFYNSEDVNRLERGLPRLAQNESRRHSYHSDIKNTDLVPKIKDENDNAETSNLLAGKTAAEPTLLKCLLTKTFLLYLFWAVAVQIILSMSLGTFNPWLEYVTNKDNSKVSEFTDILFYSMLGSPVLALCCGLGMDAMKRIKANEGASEEVRTLHTSVVSLGVTSILGVLVCGLFMTCNSDVIVVTSVALVIFRTGLYSCGTAFLRIMYPTHYFGILCGIMSVLAGGLSFLQYPLFLWIQNRNQAWLEVFGFLGVTGILSLVQPAYLYWKSRQYKKATYSIVKEGRPADKLTDSSPGIQETQ